MYLVYYKCLTITIFCSTNPMLLCTHFLQIQRLVVDLFMDFCISILLKLALTADKDEFRDVNCVKCKKWMVLCSF